ncbi:hypothetical protein C8F04DRAFT_1197057 [Mycena alexandri]|uniref:Uncharacterized protein n=1 Tax=Mycena alexandri TaxID=1745969 RepID=A0AAD6S6L2_9AGAR|nr:hypothetical protein C8F04DRAFT_1197057 [Mycena alexandri]
MTKKPKSTNTDRSPRLALELVGYTIDLIYSDKAALSACSLVGYNAAESLQWFLTIPDIPKVSELQLTLEFNDLYTVSRELGGWPWGSSYIPRPQSQHRDPFSSSDDACGPISPRRRPPPSSNSRGKPGNALSRVHWLSRTQHRFLPAARRRIVFVPVPASPEFEPDLRVVFRGPVQGVFPFSRILRQTEVRISEHRPLSRHLDITVPLAMAVCNHESSSVIYVVPRRVWLDVESAPQPLLVYSGVSKLHFLSSAVRLFVPLENCVGWLGVPDVVGSTRYGAVCNRHNESWHVAQNNDIGQFAAVCRVLPCQFAGRTTDVLALETLSASVGRRSLRAPDPQVCYPQAFSLELSKPTMFSLTSTPSVAVTEAFFPTKANTPKVRRETESQANRDLERLKIRLSEKKEQLKVAQDQSRVLVGYIKEHEARANEINGNIARSIACPLCLSTLDQPDMWVPVKQYSDCDLYSPFLIAFSVADKAIADIVYSGGARLTNLIVEAAKNNRTNSTCPCCREIIYATPSKNRVLQGLLETLFKAGAVKPDVKELVDETDPYKTFVSDNIEMEETASDVDLLEESLMIQEVDHENYSQCGIRIANANGPQTLVLLKGGFQGDHECCFRVPTEKCEEVEGTTQEQQQENLDGELTSTEYWAVPMIDANDASDAVCYRNRPSRSSYFSIAMFAFLSGHGRTAPFLELSSESTGGTFVPDEDPRRRRFPKPPKELAPEVKMQLPISFVKYYPLTDPTYSRLHSPPQHQDEFDSDSDEGRNSSRDHELDLPLLQQQLNGVLQQAAQAAGKPADQAQINAKIVTIWRCRDLGETVIASLLQEYDEDVVSVVLARLGITPSSQSDHRSLMAGPRQQRSQGHHEPSRSRRSTASASHDHISSPPVAIRARPPNEEARASVSRQPTVPPARQTTPSASPHGASPRREANGPRARAPMSRQPTVPPARQTTPSTSTQGEVRDITFTTTTNKRFWSTTSSGVFDFYLSNATYDLETPPREATAIAHEADVYIHTNTRQRALDSERSKNDPFVGRQIWVFRDNAWMDESQTDLGGIVHPTISDRRLTVHLNGDPNWIMASSISVPVRLIKTSRSKSQALDNATSD